MPSRSTSLAHIRAVAVAITLTVWAAWAAAGLWDTVAGHSARIVDFLPLWLGGRALLYRMDPTDPAVLRAVFEAAELKSRPGGFQSYYPQSAALVFSPLGYVDYTVLARPLQVVLGAGMMGGAAAAAASRTRGAHTLAAVALATGVIASLSISWVMINIGQSNTLLVLLTGVGIWALARRRPWIGGVAIGLGIAIKLFPAVLLIPALLGRRWRLVGLAIAIPVVAFLASLLLYSGPWAGSAVGAGAGWFVGTGVHPGWAANEHAVVLALWHGRFWGPGALTLALTAWAMLRGTDAVIAPLAALWVAWVGTVMAGSAMPHQAIVILPALGWLLGWALTGRHRGLAIASLAAVGAAAAWRGLFTEHLAGSLQWLPVCVVIVLGCGAAVAASLLRPSPEA